jgi:hypothetical protein
VFFSEVKELFYGETKAFVACTPSCILSAYEADAEAVNAEGSTGT